jgi:GDP-mannose 6-dehydrogenase
MNITVVGLGYVGTVSLASFAARGHKVWGVDINPRKLETLKRGESPIIEPGLQEALQAAWQRGAINVSNQLEEALQDSDLCFVSVMTPSRRNGSIDSNHLLKACSQIAQVLRQQNRRQVVAIRSSILPTVLSEVALQFEQEASGLVTLCVNPEFLREGTALADFDNPPFTLIGTDNSEAEAMLRSAYADLSAPVYVLPAAEATLVKYASNAFHALKTSFANEIGRVCSHIGLDAEAVMRVFCLDTKLNISPNYLRPGFAFGGSCLPKDVRAIQYAARLCDIEVPLVESILRSNNAVIEAAARSVLETRVRRVTLIGLSFKKNTDDLRESPFVELAELLLGKGIELRIYDPNVNIARLTGANRDYIEATIPHLSKLLTEDFEEAIKDAELVILGHRYPQMQGWKTEDLAKDVLDLTGQMRLYRTVSNSVLQV